MHRKVALKWNTHFGRRHWSTIHLDFSLLIPYIISEVALKPLVRITNQVWSFKNGSEYECYYSKEGHNEHSYCFSLTVPAHFYLQKYLLRCSSGVFF